ncbi:GDNF family receptor alpha-like [Chanos chanos]|uniref:GDNF family receptor alpha-like n=1 Tax=Chanos chanos TaxID=29144 RepID=A0A6J2V8L4_CHACN|nr:GDNF family receptor alpha-like [Chanos chanos]
MCISISSRSPDCMNLTGSCVTHTDFCKNERTLLRSICDFTDGDCQIKGTNICNMIAQLLIHNSSMWRMCFCSGEEPCSTLQLLASQCFVHFGRVIKSRALQLGQIGMQLASMEGTLHTTNRSCVQEMMLCIQDEVCNRQLVPFVQACSGTPCNISECRQAMKKFYGALPLNVAEMLVFCDCELEDKDCQHVKTTLHSDTCGVQTEALTCLEILDECLGDDLCRQMFDAFLSKCFDTEEDPYFSSDAIDWLNVMDPNLFRGGEQECRTVFVATMGSILQHPCTCNGISSNYLYRCNVLLQTFQRSNFLRYWNKGNVQHLPPQVNDSRFGYLQLHDEFNRNRNRSFAHITDQLLYIFAYLFVVVVILLAVIIILHQQGYS